jgi:Domain of unknown function (DUF5655)
MARDEQEEEREFLADLEARTGRTLGDWMAAIAAEGFADKNEAIDWLRAQGIPFARASWLERIHSNGGRPIYLHEAPKAAGEAKVPPPAPVPKPSPPPRAPAPRAAPSQREVADLDKLLAAGKGYRPLYQLLEAEIRNAVPGLVVSAQPAYISLGAPLEFAAVTLHAAELRLGLDLGDRPFDLQVQKPRLRGPGPAISHMVVLTDARQVNADLLSLIKVANGRVNA